MGNRISTELTIPNFVPSTQPVKGVSELWMWANENEDLHAHALTIAVLKRTPTSDEFAPYRNSNTAFVLTIHGNREEPETITAQHTLTSWGQAFSVATALLNGLPPQGQVAEMMAAMFRLAHPVKPNRKARPLPFLLTADVIEEVMLEAIKDDRRNQPRH